MIKGCIYRVDYHTEKSFIDGEFVPDIFKTKDFQSLAEAVSFAQKHCSVVGAARITEVVVGTRNGRKYENETNNHWEVTQDEYYKL